MSPFKTLPRIQQLIINIIFVLFVAVCWNNGQTSALRVDIVPQRAEELLTEKVTISCLVTEFPGATPNVVLMELGRRGEHSYATLGKNKLRYGANKKNNMEAEGLINELNVTESFLRLTITNPEIQDGGMYVCRLFYVDVMGDLQDGKAFANLTVETSSKVPEKSAEEINGELIKNLTDKVAALETLVTGQAKQIQDHKTHATNNFVKVVNMIAANRRNIKETTDKDNYISAFSAGFDGKYTAVKDKTLVFSERILDRGNHYNFTTGVFTAPKHGLYVFSLTVATNTNSRFVVVKLLANERKLATLHVQDDDWPDQSGVSTVVELRPGEEVRPVVGAVDGPNIVMDANHWSLFSGFLLKQL